uniref:KIAA1614 n=1 Tax=Ursus americanus TaxID=9643 RepID=A0A452SMB3_URSAM
MGTPLQGKEREHGRRSPVLDSRMPFACRDTPLNGNTSDSSSGESSSGQWPKRGASPSRVRFEDESACDAESRYLERLQQRQRQARSCALRAAAQGPLRSKPDLCRACGGCIDARRAAAGKAGPEPRALPEREAACGVQGVLAEPLSSRGPSPPCRHVPAEPGCHTEWIRETHIGDSGRPEEADSALDSTDTSDGCRTDSEEAAASQSGRPRGPARGNSPRLRASRPREGPRWFWKAESELPGSPQAPHHLPGVDAVEGAPEVKEGRGHVPEETLFPGEDGFAKPPVLESKRASLGSQWQLGPGLGNHWVHQVDSQALSRTAYALASSMKLGSSGPGRQAQDAGSHESLETASAPPLQQSSTEPSALHQAQQPTSFLCHEGWVPTPPSSRKTTSPGSHRKAGLAGPRSLGEQGEPVDPPLPPSRSVVPRTCELSPAQTQPYGPPVRHPLLALSTNNCNNSMPLGLQEPCGGASHQGRVQEGPRSQEPPPENHSDNGKQRSQANPMSTTLSLASEEPEFSREPEEGLQRPEMMTGARALTAEVGGKKSSSSLASTLGLKKLFLALGHSTRPQLGKARSYSVEQLQSPTPGPASHTSTPRAKKAPSLQSLHLVSPSHQHRKAASFQNLHSLLNGKGDRSSLYMVGEPGDHSAAGRPAKASPRRALSVEDVSAPSQARTVGRVVEVFPDGTTQLQLQRSPEGTFGFCVASGNGRRDSGFYVQEMADASMAKLYSGLLGVGDEILEVNGAKVAGLGLAHIKELLAHAESLSVRMLRQRPVPR